jgi:3-dehydroquinate synthase
LIEHSAAFKSDVTTKDPQEKGLRKILNAGHTIGHAIETYFLSSGKKILHGEAVAAGLIAEAFLSQEFGTLRKDELHQIEQYILSIFGKLPMDEGMFYNIAQLTLQDKKNNANKIQCVMFNGLGKAKWDVPISIEDITKSLAYYSALRHM